MSSDTPSSGRPTGPPSGPLSGPSQPGAPPPGPPPGGSGAGSGSGSGAGSAGGPGGPSGGAGGGTGGPGPGRPWWRSAPRIAVLACVVVAAVVLAVVLTRPGGGGDGESEVFLQAASTSGPDPFTESTAQDASPEPAASPGEADPSASGGTRAVRGSAPGLYGGTRDVASCDVERQITALTGDAAKNRAFADAQDIAPGTVPEYLRSLTPVQLRMDTRVTNHGYRDGAATPYQAVLQSGTAVLVDDRGVPRVRCACGNPLAPPVAQDSAPKPVGTAWPGYRASQVVVVEPSVTVVNVFVLYDAETDGWIARPAGDTGGTDEPTVPPEEGVSPSPSDGTSPPASESPGSEEPSSEPPAEESPSGEPPAEEPPSEAPPPEPPAEESPEAPNQSAPAPDAPQEPASPA
ncbi:DUF6777 domain-containing protein [Streptomyces sp. NPDC090029]|uniref:DUF6777 domain-containing protein n=1 Tax=Streptomyces sp. NPDC090029 TaxID=3365924 RepID=UPI003809FAB7